MATTINHDISFEEVLPPLPTFFLSHGGGPCFFMDAQGRPPFSYMDKNSDVAQWYRDFHKNFVPRKPSAIVVISAHWETSGVVSITSQSHPKLYFDYFGFPSHTYQLTYPAPGHPQLAEHIHSLLENAGIPSVLDPKRDLDHGVFVPLILMYPDASIPVIQVSLMSSLSPDSHIQIGKALKCLSSKNVLIIGSGFATHNLSAMVGGSAKSIVPWITWLKSVISTTETDYVEKEKQLINWAKAPGGRDAHPREEHLLPLHVAFGASATGNGEVINDTLIDGSALSFLSFKFS